MDRTRVRLGAMVAGLVAWALFAGSAVAADGDVTISGFAFSPTPITVTAGDTVTWTNQDNVGHTATGSGFDTGTIGGGSSASVTFDTVGTFPYVCSIHSTMSGTVVVEAATGGGGGRPTTPPTDTVTLAAGATTPTGDDPRGIGGEALLVLVLAGVLGALAPARRWARREVRGSTPGTTLPD